MILRFQILAQTVAPESVCCTRHGQGHGIFATCHVLGNAAIACFQTAQRFSSGETRSVAGAYTAVHPSQTALHDVKGTLKDSCVVVDDCLLQANLLCWTS